VVHAALVTHGYRTPDLIGIVLVASPELAPRATGALAAGRTRGRSVANRGRRLFGLAPKGTIYADAGTATMHLKENAVLMDGRDHAVGALARAADIAPTTAIGHVVYEQAVVEPVVRELLSRFDDASATSPSPSALRRLEND
jgi:hypothetical protein